MSQYGVCEMQYAKNTRISYYIRLYFAACEPACFSGFSDPRSIAQWNVCHIRHSVSRKYTQSQHRTHICQLI